MKTMCLTKSDHEEAHKTAKTKRFIKQMRNIRYKC